MISFKLFSRVNLLPDQWDAFNGSDIFLTRQYLEALENGSPSNITNYFFIVSKNSETVGVGLIQHVKVDVGQMFRYWPDSRLNRVGKRLVSNLLKGHILVGGNLTHTGQHAFHFDKNKISTEEWFEMQLKAISELSDLLSNNHRINVQMFLLKDFRPKDLELNILRLPLKVTKETVQPSMVLFIPDTWQSKEDYFNALNKKYKRRYKTARNRLKGIIRKELSLDDLTNYENDLYRLYLNVSNNAKFNTFVLPKNHFSAYKRILKGEFKIVGYFSETKLIGFYSMLLNDSTVETYFLGYEQDLLQEKQLYLNMLYDMAEFGIDNNFKKVVYARTAMEIKSSVGAVPEEFFMLIYHTNKFWNKKLPTIFNWLNPEENWIPRNPFS